MVLRARGDEGATAVIDIDVAMRVCCQLRRHYLPADAAMSRRYLLGTPYIYTRYCRLFIGALLLR